MSTSHKDTKEFKEGYEAAKDIHYLPDNPYPLGSLNHTLWMEGFVERIVRPHNNSLIKE